MTVDVMQTKQPKLNFDYPFIIPSKKGAPATIYLTPIRGEPAFTIAYHELGKRRRVVRADEDDAHKEAKKIVDRLAGAERKLSPDEGRIYERALEALLTTGLQLDDACIQFAEAWKLSGRKVIQAAADFGQRDTDTIVENKTLADAVQEYLMARKVDISAHYYREFDAKLAALCESFVGYPIAKVTPPMIDDYLRSLKGRGNMGENGKPTMVAVTSRTRKNARAVLVGFFNWAKARRYVPKSFNYDEDVKAVKAHEGEIEYFTPDELQQVLSATPSTMVPFVAIGAFAGLRHAEIARLDWSDINFDEKHIEVKAKNAKTRSRRIVPLLPILRAWLKPYRKQSGLVCSHANTSNALMRIATRAGLVWQHNCLRHSYISYRLAVVKNENQVALEAGNSPSVIFKNYRALVTKKGARAWFNIMPGPTANTVDLGEATKNAA